MRMISPAVAVAVTVTVTVQMMMLKMIMRLLEIKRVRKPKLHDLVS